MHFTITPTFSAAQRELADRSKASNDSDHDLESQVWLDLAAAEYAAIDRLMLDIDAITPTELAAKFSLYAEREMFSWDMKQEYATKILADLHRLDLQPASPAFVSAWSAWARFDANYQECSEEDMPALNAERDRLYRDVALGKCTTPGDYIVKQYLRLITTLGGHDTAAAREDMTENRWDIDIGDGDGDAIFERLDNQGAYDDLNACDVGMNLLAYGLAEFDAEAWMEAADRVGLQVCFLMEGDKPILRLGEDLEEPALPRIVRERDRLRRLLANDRTRIRQVMDEVLSEWPQLVAQGAARELEGAG